MFNWKNTSFSLGKKLSVLCIMLALVGCIEQPASIVKENEDIFQNITQASTFYLEQASTKSGDTQNGWLLLAARASLKEDDVHAAQQILDKIIPSLPSQQQLFYFLKAKVDIQNNQYDLANEMLSKIRVKQLGISQQEEYYRLIIKTHSQNALMQLRAYIQLENYGDIFEKRRVVDETWAALTGLSRESLNTMVINADEAILQGWLDLLRIKMDNYDSFDALQQAVREWQTQYPDNPASHYLPREIFSPYYTLPVDNESIKVAVLLPLSGVQAPYAQAILSGIKQAMIKNYQSGGSGEQSSSINQILIDQQLDNHLMVYDTGSQSIDALVEQANQDGNQLIIGPLLKDDVEGLMGKTIPLPVLALNQPETISANDNLCYFSLSPEDEAESAASLIYQQGKRHPLVIYSDNEIGRRMSLAFAKKWSSLSEGFVLGQSFTSYSSLKTMMNKGDGLERTGMPIIVHNPVNALKTDTDASSSLHNESEQNTESLVSDQQLQQNDSMRVVLYNGLPDITIGSTGSSIHPEKESSTDEQNNGVDAIYVIASHEEAMLIKPMLEMVPSSEKARIALSTNPNEKPKVAPLPQVYLSSRSHKAGEGEDYRLEMNNVIFSDLPFLSPSVMLSQENISTYLKQDYGLLRLYALGEDAWSLAQNYTKLRKNMQFSYKGVTGDIQVNQQCVIKRQPVWLCYTNGNVIEINKTMQ